MSNLQLVGAAAASAAVGAVTIRLCSSGGAAAATAAAGGARNAPPCEYIDPANGNTYPLEPPRWCGEGTAEQGGPRPLLITDLPGITRAEIDTTKRSLWRCAVHVL
jgi:hypothetical protein